METVGYDPWVVSMTMVDLQMTGSTQPSIEGVTSTQFVPGDGRATFNNVIVTGDISSAKFVFTITDPNNENVPDIQSSSITFLPAVTRGPCEEDEGPSFDKKQSWSSTCDYLCQSSCFDLSGLADLIPTCGKTENCDSK